MHLNLKKKENSLFYVSIPIFRGHFVNRSKIVNKSYFPKDSQINTVEFVEICLTQMFLYLALLFTIILSLARDRRYPEVIAKYNLQNRWHSG